MIKVVNLRNYKLEDGWELIRVDRSSVLGNPFKMNDSSDRERNRVCDEYEKYFLERVKVRGEFRSEVIKIYRMVKDGKNVALGCWCFPKRCHAMFIKKFIESFVGEPKGSPAPTVDTEHANSQLFLIVAGSRNITDYEYIRNVLKGVKDSTSKSLVVVHGGARGVDSLAGRACAELGIPVKVFPADWDRFGKSAGYRRNEQMHQFIAQFKNRGCLCIWDGKSKGTAHNFELAKQYNNPLQIVRFIDTEASK